MRGLRAVAAVFGAGAGFDVEQHGFFDFFGFVVREVDGLRLVDQTHQRLFVQCGDFGECVVVTRRVAFVCMVVLLMDFVIGMWFALGCAVGFAAAQSSVQRVLFLYLQVVAVGANRGQSLVTGCSYWRDGLLLPDDDAADMHRRMEPRSIATW